MNACEDFEGVFLFWNAYTKSVITAAALLILEMIPESFSGIVKRLLGWAAWDEFKMPDGLMRCLYRNIGYMFITLLFIWTVFPALNFLNEKIKKK